MGVTLWVEENEAQSVWNMLSAMVVLEVPVKVRPALVVDADEKTADLVQRCLEASGLRMVVDSVPVLADEEEFNESLAGLETVIERMKNFVTITVDNKNGAMVGVDFAAGPDQTVVAGIERHEDILGQVTYQPVDIDGKTAGDAFVWVPESAAEKVVDSHEAVAAQNKPVCEICGEAFEGRKSAKICAKPECKKARKQQYAKKYYAEHGQGSKQAGLDASVSTETVQEQPAAGTIEHQSEEHGKKFPWKVTSGSPHEGEYVSQETIEFWLKIGALPAGTFVAHYKNGRFVVIKKVGKKGHALQRVKVEGGHE